MTTWCQSLVNYLAIGDPALSNEHFYCFFAVSVETWILNGSSGTGFYDPVIRLTDQ